MKKCTTSILLLVYVLPFCYAGESDQKKVIALGTSLVDAIKKQDKKAYHACWASTAMIKKLIAKAEPNMPKKEADQLVAYFELRNKSIEESYNKIAKLIKDHGISRESLSLLNCTAHGIRVKKGIRKAGRFELQIRTDKGNWQYSIDDGFYLDEKWYFSDKPINLSFGKVMLSFKDSLNIPPK